MKWSELEKLARRKGCLLIERHKTQEIRYGLLNKLLKQIFEN
jgi:hypothetical protein